MTNDPSLEPIVARIQKLLRHAERAGTPEEAATFAAKAQALQVEHRISSLALEAETGEREEIGKGSLDVHGRTTPTWKSFLAGTLSRANGCRSYIAKQYVVGFGVRYTHMLVGRPSDQAAVRELYTTLVASIEHLTKRECAGLGRTYANNFRIGCVEIIGERLREAKRQREAAWKQQDSSMALVLVNADAAVAEWTRKNMRIGKPKSVNYNANDAARMHGRQAGSNLNIGAEGKLSAPTHLIA